jgi:hypothetical protein
MHTIIPIAGIRRINKKLDNENIYVRLAIEFPPITKAAHVD